jgi:hypothetical protein
MARSIYSLLFYLSVSLFSFFPLFSRISFSARQTCRFSISGGRFRVHRQQAARKSAPQMSYVKSWDRLVEEFIEQLIDSKAEHSEEDEIRALKQLKEAFSERKYKRILEVSSSLLCLFCFLLPTSFSSFLLFRFVSTSGIKTTVIFVCILVPTT